MKTIEERAEAYSEEHSFRIPYDGSNNFYDAADYKASKDGYIKGATEQKVIDIDKACMVYEKELRQMKRILNEVKDGAGELICISGSLLQFRKAMEE